MCILTGMWKFCQLSVFKTTAQRSQSENVEDQQMFMDVLHTYAQKKVSSQQLQLVCKHCTQVNGRIYVGSKFNLPCIPKQLPSWVSSKIMGMDEHYFPFEGKITVLTMVAVALDIQLLLFFLFWNKIWLPCSLLNIEL